MSRAVVPFAKLCALLLAGSVLAQPPVTGEPEPDAQWTADFAAFDTWLVEYRQGLHRLMRDGRDDPAALAEVRRLLTAVAAGASVEAATALLRAAAVQPEMPTAPRSEREDSVERVTFLRELQPWKVRAVAVDLLATMPGEAIDAWLVGLLREAFGRPRGEADERDPTTDAVLRVLGRRGGGAHLPELMEATLRLPKVQRIRAVLALSRVATLEVVPHFLGLLRDKEPNVRIAALNAVARALAPHTDETRDQPIDEALVGQHRSTYLDACQRVLRSDRVWQVRAAAADNLARLRTRHAIPVLITGLEAELKRKRDPWAMDVRLHQLLEGLTDQRMLPGQVRGWQQFWRENGPSFRYTASAARAEASQRAAARGERRTESFFSIDLESDRLLFVLDFSGSMREPITLKAKTTSASPGETVTKARLVVDELKKIVLSLPDDTLFNIVVFSEEVRVWRSQDDGRPALVPLDDDARDELVGSFLDTLQPAGATNLHGALATALDFGGRGLHDKYYAAGFDTLYVMSDGAPTWGKVTDPEEILRMVAEHNALRKFTIHAITFGDQNEMRFLKRLAEQNGGRHIHVE